MTSLPVYRPGLAKRRSRRLRKKLHIAEFQELGFEYEIAWEHFASASQQDEFLDAWIGIQQGVEGKLGDAWYGAYVSAGPVLDSDTCDSTPTDDEVDPTPLLGSRIEIVESGSVSHFYEIPAFVTMAKPDDFVRPQ